jgi:hypothetical protein
MLTMDAPSSAVWLTAVDDPALAGGVGARDEQAAAASATAATAAPLQNRFRPSIVLPCRQGMNTCADTVGSFYCPGDSPLT